MKTEEAPPTSPAAATPPSATTKAPSTSPLAPSSSLTPDDAVSRAKKPGVGPVRTRTAPSKTFVCRGFGDCSMVFSRSEHLARHVRKHTGERPFACHCGKQFSRLDNLRQHAQTVHSDKVDLNDRMMRDLTSLHTALAATSHRSLPRLSPSQTAPGQPQQPSRSQPSTPIDPHPGASAGVVPSMAYDAWRRDDFRNDPFQPPSPFGPNPTLPSLDHFPPLPPIQIPAFHPLTFTLTLPDGRASADFLLPTPGIPMGPFSAPILGGTDTTDLDWRVTMPVSGPWTMAEGTSPLRAEAAQGVGSLQSRPSSPEQSNHNPYFPPLPRDPQPQAGSPLGVHPLDQDARQARPAGSRSSRMDARGLLTAPRQPLHHSVSDPQLHHARARAAASAGSIAVGMYSPLSRQHWLPQDISEPRMTMPLAIDIGMGGIASHLDSGLGLHPRPPSTEADGDESGSGSDPGIDATSRMSGMDMSEMMNSDMGLAATDLGNDMLSSDDAQRAMNGMTNGAGWPSLDLLLHPQTGPHPMPRWNSDAESLEAFTPGTPTENQGFFRQAGEDTTRHFHGTRQGSLRANAPMTLGLEMPPTDQTHDPRLADLRSWNYAPPGPHAMMMMQHHLHPAFRPMASPPLSGGGSPRPSFDLRLSAASGMAPGGFPGLPASVMDQARGRYTTDLGRFQSEAGRYPPEGARFPHHPLHPLQPWENGMMTVSNGLSLGPASAREGSSGMTPPPLQVLQPDDSTTSFSTDGMPPIDFRDEGRLLNASPTAYDGTPERAYPTPLSAHPRLPVTGEGSTSGSEVKFEHQSPRLLPLQE
ncbi:hypothetical protein FRC10_005989 [Ceratobasidium sp. 414]|nr:hypothetical protein FRC10_005989 [Ceratobasidium sp. 414]